MTDPQSGSNARVAAARLAELELRLPKSLTAEERTEVEERIGRSLRLAERLRAVPLTNADEPEIVFMPYRGER